MCQIFAGKSNKIRATLLNTTGLLENLYTSNPDGLGAMYATSKQVLRTPKLVPHNLNAARAFIKQLPDDDRNLVLHFRWKTSGNIDNDNAHPFIVLPDQMAMTHNGVLSISTKTDETKCDTRHYIERVLRPQLGIAPALMHVTQWLELVGDDIQDNNRFVFMNHLGEMSFVNRETGIEHDDMWIANTYSFDASLLIPGYKKKPTYTPSLRWMDEWDDNALYGNYYSKGVDGNKAAGQVYALPGAKDAAEDDDLQCEFDGDDVWEALTGGDPHDLVEYLLDMPTFTLRTIMDSCEFVPSMEEGFSTSQQEIVTALADGDVPFLTRRVFSSDASAMNVAEAMCWYGEWCGKAINATPDVLEAEAQDELRLELLALTAGATAVDADYAG